MTPRIMDIHNAEDLVDSGIAVVERMLWQYDHVDIRRRDNETNTGDEVVPGATFSLEDSSRSTLVLAVNASVIALVTSTVFLRLGVRWTKTGRIMFDDILIFLGATFSVILSVIMLAALKYNLGKHRVPDSGGSDTSYQGASSLSELLVSANISYSCAIAATKLSLIVTILRVFRQRTVRYILYGTSAVTICLFLSSIPLTLFQCTPLQKVMGPTAAQNQCINFIDFMYVSTIIHVTTDLILLLVPLTYARKLGIPLGQKVALTLVLIVGGLACAASVNRLAVLPGLIDSMDITYDIVPTLLWALGECATCIICVSVPTTWWLLTMDNRKSTRIVMTPEYDESAPYRHESVFGRSTPDVSYVTERTAQEVETMASNGTKTTSITYVTKLKPVAKPTTTWAKGHRSQRSWEIGLWD